MNYVFAALPGRRLPSRGSTLTLELLQYVCRSRLHPDQLGKCLRMPESWLYPPTDKTLMAPNRHLPKYRSVKGSSGLVVGTVPQHRSLSLNVNSAAFNASGTLLSQPSSSALQSLAIWSFQLWFTPSGWVYRKSRNTKHPNQKLGLAVQAYSPAPLEAMEGGLKVRVFPGPKSDLMYASLDSLMRSCLWIKSKKAIHFSTVYEALVSSLIGET